MRVENQVSTFIQTEGHPVRIHIGKGSWLPEQEVAIGIENLRLNADLHATKTGSRLLFPTTGHSCPVNQDVRVMDESFIAGAYLDGLNPPRPV